MNISSKLLIIVLSFSLMYNVFSNDTKKMLFSSPIIYKPVIDLALSRNTKPLNKHQPTKIPKFKIMMIISKFSPRNEEKEKFDSFFQISFKEIENIKFLIFKKDNFIQELHVVNSEKKVQSITKYKRSVDSLLSKISKENHAYYKKTKQTIISLLRQEDVLANLPLGEHILTFKLELLTGVAIGDIYISDYPYYHSFCFSGLNYINSALRNNKTKGLIFAVTGGEKDIKCGDLFDEKILNGFQASFYPNQGLKYLTNLKNGNQGNVMTWGINGKNGKKVSIKEWFKQIQNHKK